jgi:hypothetical protein
MVGSDSDQGGEIRERIATADLPGGWRYDPDWTWGAVDAVVYHESLFDVLDGTDEVSYVVEIRESKLLLRRIRRDDDNDVVDRLDRTDETEDLESLLEAVEV